METDHGCAQVAAETERVNADAAKTQAAKLGGRAILD
jgi:hypothetical protein